ncbi:MAG: hypothetical protein ACYSR0_09540 [Planctomycetota bacterium]|jgi:hypothetical protein
MMDMIEFQEAFNEYIRHLSKDEQLNEHRKLMAMMAVFLKDADFGLILRSYQISNQFKLEKARTECTTKLADITREP